jgi:DNA (cytosine-5)-methyltransferase 1
MTLTADNAQGHHLKVEAETDISRYAIGRAYDRVGYGGRGIDNGRKFWSLERPDIDQPVPTVVASLGDGMRACMVHPTEKRKFSVAELKRLCSFPDDFILTGSFSQQCERLGNAVPPVMMSHVAATIRDRILLT